MRERLDEIESRYDDLTRELSKPEVAADPARLRDLGKQHAELEEIVAVSRAHRQAVQQVEEARALAEDERDPEMAEYLKAEEADAERRAASLARELEALLLPKDPNDRRDVVVEIRAGAGGQEAALFASELLEMYRRYAERRRWKTEVLSASPSDLGGFKEVVLEVRGRDGYSRLKHESGTHRVQRVPVTESGGRIHTSTATVAVLPQAEEVDVRIDPDDLQIDVFRSSGPGGQSVNTTDSAVRVTHKPSGIVVSVQEERSQRQNREKAMRYLRARLLKMAQDEQQREEAATRKAQVGSAERSEKIRTYNFPQNRVTDHRLKLSLHNLPEVLAGGLDEFIDRLRAQERRSQLAGDDGHSDGRPRAASDEPEDRDPGSGSS
jgi:peptide chain release factor 1